MTHLIVVDHKTFKELSGHTIKINDEIKTTGSDGSVTIDNNLKDIMIIEIPDSETHCSLSPIQMEASLAHNVKVLLISPKAGKSEYRIIN